MPSSVTIAAVGLHDVAQLLVDGASPGRAAARCWRVGGVRGFADQVDPLLGRAQPVGRSARLSASPARLGPFVPTRRDGPCLASFAQC